MLEFLRDSVVTANNPFKTASIKRIHFLPFEGLKSSDYGGRVNSVAELKDSDLFLIVDKDLKTIDVARIKVEEAEQLQEAKVFITCKKCNEEFDNKGNFLTHTRKCK